jgi:Domain of unknown function (DUF4395)
MTKRPYGVILDQPTTDGSVFRAGVFNEIEVRAAAGITMALGTYAFVYANFAKYFLPIRLVTTFFFIDFLIRVTVGLHRSPVGIVSRWITRGRPPEWVSAQPKRFAWTLGLVMSAAMTVITNVSIHGVLPRTICLICLALMWLESVLGLCLGCQIYALLVRRGAIGKNDAYEVCAGGVCAVPSAPAEPRALQETG